MGERIDSIVERVRLEKGAFFVARVALRLGFPLGKGETRDTPEHEQQLVDACVALGYDPESIAKAD